MDPESVNTQSGIDVGCVGSPVETNEGVDNNFEVDNHFVSISFFENCVGSRSSSSSGCGSKTVSVGSCVGIDITRIGKEVIHSWSIDWA